MPSVYFISPFQPPVWVGFTDFEINIEEFTKQILAKWGKAEFAIAPESNTYILTWDLMLDADRRLEGGVQVGRQVISFQGTINEVAEFALWYRGIVEDRFPLFMFDDGLHMNCVLNKQTTRNEIMQLI